MGKFKRKGFGLLTLFCAIATLFSLTSCGGDVIGGDNNDFENTGDKNDSEDTGNDNQGDEGTDEHTHTYVEEVTNPTCTEKGFTTYTCSCGDSYVDSYVNPLGHTYSEKWSYDSTHHWHAAICEHSEEKSDKAEHTFDGSSCTICGYALETSSDYFNFTLKVDDTYEISAKNVDKIPKDVVLPSNYEGKPVTSIGDNGFSGAYKLTTIKIPNTIKTIGVCSFEKCSALKSISIPESVTAIGWRAFFNSYNLKTIELPETVVNISRDAFYNTAYFNDNSNWEEGALYLGKHLIRYDFTKANNTEEYKVKDGTLRIAAGAFYQAEELTSVTIPSSVINIGDQAFEYCNLLKNAHINDISAFFNIDFQGSTANPVYFNGNLFLNDTLVTEINANDLEGLTTIKKYALPRCNSIENIELPNTITNIGKGAFTGCLNLKSVTIPDNVTVIDDFAFSGDQELETVNISENSKLEIIGVDAFSLCYKLSSFLIPDSVTSIGINAFIYDNLLENVIIGENSKLTTIGRSAFDSCKALTSIIIPQNVTLIYDSAFARSGLKKATFKNPNGWYTSYESDATSGVTISSEDLSNQLTAAQYLTSNYYDRYWFKS